MCILVVEDEPRVCSLIERGLQEASFAVDTAKDGEQDLRLAPLLRTDRPSNDPGHCG